jgi:hypothetical protein
MRESPGDMKPRIALRCIRATPLGLVYHIVAH